MNLGSFFEPDLKGEFVYNIDRKGIFFYRIGEVDLNALSCDPLRWVKHGHRAVMRILPSSHL